MLTREVALLALICIQSQPLHAELHRSDRFSALLKRQAAAETDVCRVSPLSQPNEPAAGDILAGRGIDAYKSLLRQIAIYASVGNREGQEILTAQLRVLGVSAEAVNEMIAWTKLHDCLPDSSSTGASAGQILSTVPPEREASR
jgi:hypothetical protein